MKCKIILGLAVVLSSAELASSASTAGTNSLRVVVVPSKTDVRAKEPFKVALRVENPTATNQTVRVMNCSWDEHWKSSNTNISWIGWGCGKNFPMDITIPSGGAYTNVLQMLIPEPVSRKSLTFCMGFTPIGSAKTFWSGAITLKILPPDTWQRGEAIYRDRNHDGKMDWEVSGTTWMGHAVYPSKTVTNSNGDVMSVLEMTGQGVDTYKVDTNHDGFYDSEYGARGTNGQIQWTKPIHERVPVVGKGFIPIAKPNWITD